jgi:hypothetical protein
VNSENTGRKSQVENEAATSNGRPEWTRTIDLFRVKNEVTTLNPFPYLAFPQIQAVQDPLESGVLMELMATLFVQAF